ncbi:hypothetical protein [Paenibacillus sp. UNC451MF]|uniref:hypothetical protein n=1 Tax=Paenibacillus sp. UNC451MF TaxID=1449063 RepID=UPI00068DB566|nr:hypothetical protein [Paenibacillus sp. UNC451MF]
MKQLIQQAMPSGASVIHPKNSTDSGSIYLKDLNNDGTPEAIVFYQTPDKEVRIKGMLWQKSGDSWVLLSEIEGEGYELETLLFEDVTNDGSTDILAGYSGGPKINKGLVIYHLDGQKLNKLFQAPYTELVVDDLNQDQIKDITLLTLDRNVSAKISTIQYKTEFQTIGTTTLDPYVNAYYNLAAGYVTESKRGLLLDASVGAHSSNTQLIYFDGGKLVKAFPDDKLPFNPGSTKSGDFNGDGILEIGISVAPKGSEEEAYAYTPWITQYYRWDGKQGLASQPIYKRYYDYTNGFYFDIPSEWNDSFRVIRDIEGNAIHFLALDQDETLVEWRTIPIESRDAADTEWKEIGRTDKTITVLHMTEMSREYANQFHSIMELEQKEDSHE